MIKFFRKIRQNLLMENKTSKYFKYAIGEIVLVVIGILIALQINNWNEQRKLSEKATKYVNKIKNDLKVDTLNIGKLIKKGNDYKKNIEKYFDYFDSSDSLNISMDSLRGSISKINAKYLQYYPVNKTFKDMESLGNSNLLSDPQRDFLIKLADQQQELEIIIDSYITIAINQTQKSSEYLGKPLNFYKNLNQKNSTERKTQGLLHIHLHLDALSDLYYYINIKGKKLIKLSTEAIDLLNNNND